MAKSIHDELKGEMQKKHVSYVLITCDEPKSDGSMDVQMSYGGDPLIAEYLIHTAQGQFESVDH
ncbi:MAG: hypothetical protein VX777_10285 [Chlamydiota bacterium]|nr:hypothetical protein [Chlamydiota bacterium]